MIYIDGFLIPILAGSTEEAYRLFAEKAVPIFKDHGATRVVEGWADDIPHGKVTDFYRAVQARDSETVVFSWIEWPDKATRNAGMKKVMEDARMKPSGKAKPLDGSRMILGGFRAIVDQ
jgi:uncharacterized protein YbaA (DUF1428 family)